MNSTTNLINAINYQINKNNMILDKINKQKNQKIKNNIILYIQDLHKFFNFDNYFYNNIQTNSYYYYLNDNDYFMNLVKIEKFMDILINIDDDIKKDIEKYYNINIIDDIIIVVQSIINNIKLK
jgi:hypothetical protein